MSASPPSWHCWPLHSLADPVSSDAASSQFSNCRSCTAASPLPSLAGTQSSSKSLAWPAYQRAWSQEASQSQVRRLIPGHETITMHQPLPVLLPALSTQRLSPDLHIIILSQQTDLVLQMMSQRPRWLAPTATTIQQAFQDCQPRRWACHHMATLPPTHLPAFPLGASLPRTPLSARN